MVCELRLQEVILPGGHLNDPLRKMFNFAGVHACVLPLQARMLQVHVVAAASHGRPSIQAKATGAQQRLFTHVAGPILHRHVTVHSESALMLRVLDERCGRILVDGVGTIMCMVVPFPL